MGGQELLLSFGGLEQRCCFLSHSPLSLFIILSPSVVLRPVPFLAIGVTWGQLS